MGGDGLSFALDLPRLAAPLSRWQVERVIIAMIADPAAGELVKLTVRQAALALSVSERTIRRRIGAGDLPATQEAAGGASRTVVDQADLAAFAQAEGLAWAGDSAALTGAATQAVTGADRQALVARIGDLERRNRELETERERLWGHVETLTRLLPPARVAEPPARSWWARLRGRSG